MIQLKTVMGTRVAIGALWLAGLSGCGAGPTNLALVDRPSVGGLFSGLTRSGPKTPEPPQRRVALVGGDIVIDTPEGWCIEPASLNHRGQRGFAVVVGCRSLREGEAQNGVYVPPGALTVAISRKRAPGDAPASEALLAAVSADEITGQNEVDGVALVKLRPKTPSTPESLGDPYWRAVFVHKERAIALAAYGPPGGDIANRAGGALLLALADGIRGHSPD